MVEALVEATVGRSRCWGETLRVIGGGPARFDADQSRLDFGRRATRSRQGARDDRQVTAAAESGRKLTMYIENTRRSPGNILSAPNRRQRRHAER
jgi:hypothetical protein